MYSAVLTVFNAENTVLNALNSIMEQSVAPSEIIIVDDCSTDNTFRIVNKVESATFNIRIFRNEENLGVAYSRNFAVEMAEYQNVIFFDDDDISLPYRATKHLQHLDGHVGVSFVSSSKIYANGYTVDNFSDNFIGKFQTQEFIRNQMLGGKDRFSTPSSCMAIKRDTFLSVGGFDKTLRRLEDTDLSIRLSLAGVVFAFSDEIYVERFDLGKPPSTYESASQKQILNKFQNYLGRSDFKLAVFKIDIHELYFQKRYIHLVFRFAREIFQRPLALSYFFTGLKRLKHDWLKK